MKQTIVARHTKGLSSNIDYMDLVSHLSKLPSWNSKNEQILKHFEEQVTYIRQLDETENIILLMASNKESYYLCCINKKECPINVFVPIIRMGLIGTYIAYDAINKVELGMVDDTLNFNLPASQIGLIKLISIK